MQKHLDLQERKHLKVSCFCAKIQVIFMQQGRTQ